MPYYTAQMVAYMRQQAQNGSPKRKGHKTPQLKETPIIDDKQEYESFLAEATGSKVEGPLKPKKKRVQRLVAFNQLFPGQPKDHSNVPFDQRRLAFMKQLLRRQVERIMTVSGPLPVSQYQREFEKYEIIPDPEYRQMYTWIPGQTIHRARHLLFDYPHMMAAVHTDKGKNFRSPIYFKILQHLGKKHPNVLQTWDIFLDQKNQVIVFQEYPTRGDLGKLIADKGPQPEARVQEWARQLYQALSYLGDMAICHNDLMPAYVALHGREWAIRLTGFYRSVVYWSNLHEKVVFFPCLPHSRRNLSQPDFKAPEVYGDGESEEFDPIAADIWSYGAILFYALTALYPYNYEKISNQMEEEIQRNVARLQVSREARALLKEALTTQVLERLSFDKIPKFSWLFKQDSPKQSFTNSPNGGGGGGGGISTKTK